MDVSGGCKSPKLREVKGIAGAQHILHFRCFVIVYLCCLAATLHITQMVRTEKRLFPYKHIRGRLFWWIRNQNLAQLYVTYFFFRFWILLLPCTRFILFVLVHCVLLALTCSLNRPLKCFIPEEFIIFYFSSWLVWHAALIYWLSVSA